MLKEKKRKIFNTVRFFSLLLQTAKIFKYIQGVSEIDTLILTGNRTRQKEQLFYFAEKRCLIPKKNWRDFSLK
jgi:hypothetical protein